MVDKKRIAVIFWGQSSDMSFEVFGRSDHKKY